MIYVLIQVFCLYVGMYGLFNGSKSWRWICATNAVMAVVNLIRL